MNEDFNLMKETLVTANEYATKLMRGIEYITVNIQKGREDKALTMCIELLDGLKWLIDAINLTLPFQQAHDQPISLDLLGNLLPQLAEALENKDYVLLGDILEYELTPTLNEWQEQLGNLLSK